MGKGEGNKIINEKPKLQHKKEILYKYGNKTNHSIKKKHFLKLSSVILTIIISSVMR